MALCFFFFLLLCTVEVDSHAGVQTVCLMGDRLFARQFQPHCVLNGLVSKSYKKSRGRLGVGDIRLTITLWANQVY